MTCKNRKITALMKAGSILLCGVGGMALAWLIGYSIYFFTEVFPFRNDPVEIRVFHAVDGWVAIGILTIMFLMPGCAIAGSLVAAFLLRKREIEIVTLTRF
ncbi:MAG: hypothetical protein SF097_07085 [Acidobacteriota bacterium]|nr:hypothetical protein [Acidobacteriota bacterium]